ncbi:MAG: sugar transferase, partial [Mangrovimonas sp.]|nr:sugar transferase [Mangrovimonas sp.]
MSKSSIHFNISERKILLRVFDAVFVLLSLYLVSYQFDFDYFTITEENWNWVLVLLFYLTIFGTVFELYDLQKASRWEQVLANILLTTSVTVAFYLMTPFYTPFLPEKRLHILYFFLSILVGLIVWRLIYIKFVASPRFHKKVLIIGEVSNLGFIIDAFKKADPYYHIVGFINSEKETVESISYKGLKEYSTEELK